MCVFAYCAEYMYLMSLSAIPIKSSIMNGIVLLEVKEERKPKVNKKGNLVGAQSQRGDRVSTWPIFGHRLYLGRS